MASAVLANRGEGNWPMQTKDSGSKFMGRVPNPKPKKRNFHKEINGGQIDDASPAVAQSAASDDASSINRRPINDHLLVGNCVSFNVDSYSKKQLFELKNRLISELDRIRQLKNRIELEQFRSGSKKSSVSGNKRLFLSNESKKLNQQDSSGKLMKSCGQILAKLMKHKHGCIFNFPVDVVGMGLHDYYDVIKNPMDLGTVKLKLSQNIYDSPESFAADVRLTFNNAITYNPKIHEVHAIAEQFLARFEELFRPINEKLVQEEVFPANSWNFHEVKQQNLTKSEHMQRVLATGSSPSPRPNPPAVAPQMPVRTPSPVRVTTAARPLKQPKPKAKDPNKREMSMAEKQRLGIGLQRLPQEKMVQVIQILKKRNGNLRQDEDEEIELDIEALDSETLWELDRFVTNYKKMVCKIRRKALMALNNVSSAEANWDVPMVEKNEVARNAKKVKKGEAGEEDVDIGDEIPMSSFPPVEIEKDNAHTNDIANSSSSSSGSSSSDSSSSSDADSGSSSGSDSDADNARL